MNAIGASIISISLLSSSYFVFKEAFHNNTPEEMMDQLNSHDSKAPKLIAILLGVLCFIGALYLPLKFITDLDF